MVFFAVVAVPVVRRAQEREGAMRLLVAMARRFRGLAWASLGVLVATGVANLHFHRITLGYVTGGELWTTPFGRALAYKLSFVVAAVGVSAIHQVLTPADSSAPVSPLQRRVASWSGRLVLLLSLGALYFAIALVRGLPWL
jgi:hypothetical protein